MDAARVSITAIELAAMRDQAESLMPDSCVVKRTTNVSDGQGGTTTTTATAGTYACNGASGPHMRMAAEAVIAGQVTPEGAIFISLPWDADVREADRIEWTRAAGGSTTVVEVNQVSVRSWQINTRVTGKDVT